MGSPAERIRGKADCGVGSHLHMGINREEQLGSKTDQAT